MSSAERTGVCRPPRRRRLRRWSEPPVSCSTPPMARKRSTPPCVWRAASLGPPFSGLRSTRDGFASLPPRFDLSHLLRMRVEIGTRGVAYDDAGEGRPVLFIHGFPHHRKLWAPQLRALAGHSRAIAMDLPGFGESDMPERFSIDAWADGLARFLDALSIDRAVIAGLSMGGYVTLAFWRLHRARVLALVLADTRAGADTEEGKAKRRETIELARRERTTPRAPAMLSRVVGESTRER